MRGEPTRQHKAGEQEGDANQTNRDRENMLMYSLYFIDVTRDTSQNSTSGMGVELAAQPAPVPDFHGLFPEDI